MDRFDDFSRCALFGNHILGQVDPLAVYVFGHALSKILAKQRMRGRTGKTQGIGNILNGQFSIQILDHVLLCPLGVTRSAEGYGFAEAQVFRAN